MTDNPGRWIVLGEFDRAIVSFHRDAIGTPDRKVLLRMFFDIAAHDVHVLGSAPNRALKFLMSIGVIGIADHESKKEIRWKLRPTNVGGEPTWRTVIDAHDLERVLDGRQKFAVNAPLLEIV